MTTGINRINERSWFSRPFIMGEMTYLLSGVTYVVTLISAGAATVGLTGAVMGAYLDSENRFRGALKGGKTGLCWGSGAGLALGTYKSAPYTFQLCKEYSESCQALEEARNSFVHSQKMTEKTKEVVYSFLFQFCEDRDEGAEQQICCSVNREMMLYPARITTCAKPHFHELFVLHELLKRGNGDASCSICQIAFQAKDIEIDIKPHNSLKEVVKEAFAYLMPVEENLLLEHELKKNRERFMGRMWGQTFNRLPILLTDDIGERIRRKEPLPIDVTWTLCSAFRSLCQEFVQKNQDMMTALIKDLREQKELKRNSEGQDVAEITREQYTDRFVQITDLKEENAKLFDFEAVVNKKNL